MAEVIQHTLTSDRQHIAFVQPGHHEAIKATMHGAMGVLAVLCATYNAAAWRMRREPHLLVNTLLYGSIVALEITQIRRHCTRSMAVTDHESRR